MRKSTAKMLSLFLAFMIAFTSVSIPSYATEIDTDEVLVAEEANVEEVTENPEEIVEEVDSENEKAVENSEEVADEATEEEAIDEAAIEEDSEVSEEVISDEAGSETASGAVIEIPDSQVVSFPAFIKTGDVYPFEIYAYLEGLREDDEWAKVKSVSINGESVDLEKTHIRRCNWNNMRTRVNNGIATSDSLAYFEIVGDISLEAPVEDAEVQFTVVLERYGEETTTTSEYTFKKTVSFLDEVPGEIDMGSPIYFGVNNNFSKFINIPADSMITKVEFVKDEYSKEVELGIVERAQDTEPKYSRLCPGYEYQVPGREEYIGMSWAELGSDYMYNMYISGKLVNKGIYDLRVTTENSVITYKNAVDIDGVENTDISECALVQDAYYINGDAALGVAGTSTVTIYLVVDDDKFGGNEFTGRLSFAGQQTSWSTEIEKCDGYSLVSASCWNQEAKAGDTKEFRITLYDKNDNTQTPRYYADGTIKFEDVPGIKEIDCVNPTVLGKKYDSLYLEGHSVAFTLSNQTEKIVKAKFEKDGKVEYETAFTPSRYGTFNKYSMPNTKLPYKTELVVGDRTISVDLENNLKAYADCTSIFGNIPIKTELPQGIYDVVLVSNKGEEYRYNGAINVTDKPVVQRYVMNSQSRDYVCDNTEDYIAFVVYGYNLSDDLVPLFYMDKDFTKEAAVYDVNDGNCAKSPDLGDGRIYKVRKTADMKALDKGDLFVRFDSADVIYTGYSTIKDADNNDVGVTGAFYNTGDSPFTVFGKNTANKMFKIYFKNRTVANGEINEGDVVTVSANYYDNGKMVHFSETVVVAKDVLGKLYAEVPATSELYKAVSSRGYGVLEITSTSTNYRGSVFTDGNVDIKKLTNISIAKGKYRVIDAMDMGNILASGNAGTNVLSNSEIDRISKYPAVIVENTNEEGVLISVNKVTIVSNARDMITYVDAGDNTENPEIVFKGESITLASPKKDGYTFGGWYMDAAFRTKVTTITGAGGKNITLYAKWTANEYSITLSGADKEDIITVKYGDTFVIAPKNVIKKGSTIVKWWNSNRSASIEADQEVSVKDLLDRRFTDLKLIAEFKQDTYKIIYKLNGADNALVKEWKKSFVYGDTGYELPELGEGPAGYEFAGWYKNADFSGEKVTSLDFSDADEDISLYAKWVPAKYKIVYKTNVDSFEGNAKLTNTKKMPENSEYSYGEIFTLPANVFTMAPSVATDRTKYIFGGWTTDLEDAPKYGDKANVCFEANDAVDGVITLYAVFYPTESTKFKIFYNYDYAGRGVDSTEYTVGVVQKYITPERPGYIFKGWTNDVTGKIVTGVTAKDTGDIYLTANWVEKQYTVAFAANGGTGKIASFKINYTDEVVLSKYADIFSKIGSFQDGWNIKDVDAGFGKDDYFSPSNFAEVFGSAKNGAKITISARWQEEEYSITYHMDEYGFDNKYGKYKYSTTPVELMVPTEVGMDFVGWYFDYERTKPAGAYNARTNKATLKAKTYGNINLYPKFVCNYSIVLHNTGKEETKTLTGYSSAAVKALPANTFKAPEGKIFAGWSKSISALTPNYADKGKVTGYNGVTISSDKNNVLHLYAVWADASKAKYVVSFVSSYGYTSGKMTDQTMTYGKDVVLKKNAYTRPDAIFVGWTAYATVDGNNRWGEFSDGQPINGFNGVYPDNGKITLYAKWKDTVTISFDVNADGAELPHNKSELTYKYGTTMSAKDFAKVAVPTKHGYDFAGWYTEPGCKKAFKSITKATKQDITLYAKWTPKKFVIKFASGISSVPTKGTMKNQTITYGKPTALNKCTLSIPGYRFACWCNNQYEYIDDQALVSDVAGYYPGGGEITYYAQWEEIEYTITYVDAVAGNDTDKYTTVNVVDLKEPTKLGYTFQGWYTDAKCTKRITEIKPGTVGDKTLYAKWQKIQ